MSDFDSGFDFDAPDSVEGESNFLKAPGTYHCSVLEIVDGLGPKGNPISGFCIHLSVEAGTVQGQEGKETSLCLFNPDLTKSESSQVWAKRKQAAFFIATDLLQPADLGKRVRIDLQAAKNQQVVIEFEEDNRDGKNNLQLVYANIYHVDDPRAADYPKNKEVLALLPKESRHDAAYFAPLMKKKDAAAAGSETRQPALSASDLADL